MTPFLLLFDSTAAATREVLQHLDAIGIQTWFQPFPGTVLVIATAGETGSGLSHKIRNRFPTANLLVVPAVLELLNGWMPQRFWDLLKATAEPPNLTSLKRLVAKLASARPPGSPPSPSETTLQKLIDQLVTSIGDPNNPKA